jgi:hypothetical protein
MPGVVCSAIAVHNAACVLAADAVGAQELARLVRSVNLEALILRPVLLGQAEIMEHGTDVEHFGIR